MKPFKREAHFTGIVVFAAITLLFTLFSGCGESADPVDPVDPTVTFHSQTYTISAAETMAKLNLAPIYVFSDDEAVAIVEIVDGGVVITSKKQGGTTVYAANAAGGSNSARIPLEVEASGAIKVRGIEPFDENRAVESIVKEPVTVSGKVNAEITPEIVKLMMDNNDFVNVTINSDASAWITNLPARLSAKISSVQGGEHIHEVTLTVSGMPVQVNSERLSISIPKENSANGWAVFVTPREDAVFAITEN